MSPLFKPVTLPFHPLWLVALACGGAVAAVLSAPASMATPAMATALLGTGAFAAIWAVLGAYSAILAFGGLATYGLFLALEVGYGGVLGPFYAMGYGAGALWLAVSFVHELVNEMCQLRLTRMHKFH